MMRRVVVYTQPGCAFSGQVKRFLREQGVAFVERDVRADRSARDDLVSIGYAATPVTIIDGRPIVGFDAAELERLLVAPVAG